MNAHPTNPALEAAIRAHADEDTPRLAYADWLDEYGDPDRAAFIRTQCRIAEVSPAHPDWVGLTEQQNECVARLSHRRLTRVVEGVPGFSFGLTVIERHKEPFRRGFPYSVSCNTYGTHWTTSEVARVATELTRLVRTTTVRSVHLTHTPIDRLTELLAAPVVGALTGLTLAPGTADERPATVARFYRALGKNPALRRLRRLDLSSGASDAALLLVGAEAFESVARLRVWWHRVDPTVVSGFLDAPWVRRVRDFSATFDSTAAEALATGVARLPDLHTLDSAGILTPAAASALAAGAPALERLIYHGLLATSHAEALARGRFPALVALEATRGGVTEEALEVLLKADWFGRLRVLRLNECPLGDRAVEELAAHPVAQNLRALHLGDSALGPDGLAALGKAGAFPNLTTLNPWLLSRKTGTPKALAPVMAALHIPNLKHLDLNGWQLGDSGVQALANNPALAGLTRLSLDRCGIGDAGAAALLASPHLQNLVELRLGGNPIRHGADALTDPGVMPRLGLFRLEVSNIPRATAVRLAGRPGLDFTG